MLSNHSLTKLSLGLSAVTEQPSGWPQSSLLSYPEAAHGEGMLGKQDSAIALELSPRHFYQSITLLITGIVFASGLGQFAYAHWPQLPGLGLVARIVDIDAERSLPTAYSSLALFCCALLQAVIAASPRLTVARFAKRWRRLAWIFFCLSLDELLGFHELAIDPVRAHLNVDGVFYFAWVVPALFLVSFFFISFLRFWLHLPRQPRALFLIAALCFVGGALGVEMVNGYYINRWGEDGIYLALQHLEEFLEMWGIATLLYAMLSYICIRLDSDRLGLSLRARSPQDRAV